MNQTPRLNWNGYVGPIENSSCGRLACENDAITFWQSRMTRDNEIAPLPQLVDIPSLAKAARELPANAEPAA